MTIFVFFLSLSTSQRLFFIQKKTPQTAFIRSTILISNHSQGENTMYVFWRIFTLFRQLWHPTIEWLVHFQWEASKEIHSVVEKYSFDCMPKTREYLAACVRITFALNLARYQFKHFCYCLLFGTKEIGEKHERTSQKLLLLLMLPVCKEKWNLSAVVIFQNVFLMITLTPLLAE